MPELTTEERNALPDSAFALPDRRYPIHNIEHARNALARVSQHGTDAEKHDVRTAVFRRYPSLREEDVEPQPKRRPPHNPSPTTPTTKQRSITPKEDPLAELE